MGKREGANREERESVHREQRIRENDIRPLTSCSWMLGYSPWLPFVMSFYLSQGEKGGSLTHVCTWLPLSCPSTHRKVNRGGFKICLHLAFPTSCLPTYLAKWQLLFIIRKMEEGSDVCAYLAFTLGTVMSSYLLQCEKGVVSAYVCTWFCLCHAFLLIRL